MSDGTITITKMVATDNCIRVTIRLPDRSINAELSLDNFANALFGLSDVPCATKVRMGKFNGTNKPIIGESK